MTKPTKLIDDYGPCLERFSALAQARKVLTHTLGHMTERDGLGFACARCGLGAFVEKVDGQYVLDGEASKNKCDWHPGRKAA